MSDWRSVRMAEIDWRAMKSHIGRSASALRRLSIPFRNRPTYPYADGAWMDLTLGEVADLGAREILRYAGMGKVSLAALQSVIDMAEAGKLPLSNGVAIDALRPTKEGKGNG